MSIDTQIQQQSTREAQEIVSDAEIAEAMTSIEEVIRYHGQIIEAVVRTSDQIPMSVVKIKPYITNGEEHKVFGVWTVSITTPEDSEEYYVQKSEGHDGAIYTFFEKFGSDQTKKCDQEQHDQLSRILVAIGPLAQDNLDQAKANKKDVSRSRGGRIARALGRLVRKKQDPTG